MTITNEMIKDAELILGSINRGIVNILQIKSFLAKVVSKKAPSSRKTAKQDLYEQLEARVK